MKNFVTYRHSTDYNAVRRILCAYWIINATNTYLEHVIFFFLKVRIVRLTSLLFKLYIGSLSCWKINLLVIMFAFCKPMFHGLAWELPLSAGHDNLLYPHMTRDLGHSQVDKATDSVADKCPVNRFFVVVVSELWSVTFWIVFSSGTEGPQQSTALNVEGTYNFELINKLFFFNFVFPCIVV